MLATFAALALTFVVAVTVAVERTSREEPTIDEIRRRHKRYVQRVCALRRAIQRQSIQRQSIERQ